ncbi:hypothetical protein HC891_25185 [Candidatus Gracilibacteria bacterium]|nr:hypothetical protein [Candidatus Gracilibacteria bacterium]
MRLRMFHWLIGSSVLLLVLSTATAAHRESPATVELAILPQPTQTMQPALAQDEPPVEERVYLPFVNTGPAVAVRFGSGFNQETFELIEPGDRFAYGLRKLYIETTYANADNFALQRVLTFPDGREERSTLVTIAPDEGGRLAVYCLRPTTSTGCDNAAILPPWHLHLYRLPRR